MTGKLVVRRDDGSVEMVSVTGAIQIGSAPQSDLRLYSDGVLPLHARAGLEAGEYWIRDAGDAGLAVNGERIVEKRVLRHLDVITLGQGSVNVIFSTTAASLPVPARTKAPPPPPREAVSVSPNMTMVFQRFDVTAPSFAPAAEEEASGPNTILGVPPGAVPAFKPEAAEPATNTMFGVRTPGVMPAFKPFVESDAPVTMTGIPVAANFRIADPDPEISPRNTIVEPVNPGSAPKFEIAASLIETVMPTSAPTVITKAVKPARLISGVTFRGIGGVLNARLGRSMIGRGATATIRIDSAEVSKVHAVVDVTPTSVTLTDQKSVNGTTVNGSPLSGPRELVEGDRVSFATFEFRVEFVRMGGSE